MNKKVYSILFAIMLVSMVVLTGCFERKKEESVTVVVSFNLNYTTTTQPPADKTVEFGASYGTLPTQTRESYTLDGWYTTSSGGTKIESQTKVDKDSNHILYAHWTPVSPTAPNAPTMADHTHFSITLDTQQGVEYSRDNGSWQDSGIFVGLNADTDYSFVARIKSTDTHPSSDSSPSATFRTASTPTVEQKVTVGFELNYVASPSNPPSVEAVVGGVYGTLPIATRPNYDFNGWWTTPVGGSQILSTTTVTQSTDHTLYARWDMVQTQLWSKVVANAAYTLAINSNRQLYAWGNVVGMNGSMGDKNEFKLVPTKIGNAQDWIDIASGYGHSLAINASGQLWAWGSNSFGQLGLGNKADQANPTRVGTDTNWQSVYAGTISSYAIKTDGTLWAFGDNSSGNLGLGNSGDGTEKTTPTRVGTANNWKRVSASQGFGFVHALNTDNQLFSWGTNTSGALGLGNSDQTAIVPTPTRVGNGEYKDVSVGVNHVLAVQTNGTLWAWGRNQGYKLGVNDTSIGNVNPYPVHIVGRTDWANVSAGSNHSLGMLQDGSIYGWGYGDNGELGLGEIEYGQDNRFLPTRIGISQDWSALSAGSSYSMIINNKGELYASGDNGAGALGLGDMTYTYTDNDGNDIHVNKNRYYFIQVT